MPRTVVQIYAAAVCFASLACLAIALGVVAYSAVAIVNPSFTMHPMNMPPERPFVPMTAPEGLRSGVIPAPPQLSEEERSKRRAEAMAQSLRNEVATGRHDALRWGISAVIAAVLFWIHWRILRREIGDVA